MDSVEPDNGLGTDNHTITEADHPRDLFSEWNGELNTSSVR